MPKELLAKEKGNTNSDFIGYKGERHGEGNEGGREKLICCIISSAV